MFFVNKTHDTRHPPKVEFELPSLTCNEVKPLLQVCQPFGLVPFSLKNYRTCTNHYVALGVKAIVISLTISAAILIGPMQYMRKPMESLLFTIVVYMIMWIHLICVGNVYTRCITQRTNMISILHRLQTVIFHLRSLSIVRKRECRHVRVRVLGYTLVFYVNIIITIANMCKIFKSFVPGLLFLSADTFANCIMFFIELQYIILFYVLYRKFLLINETISKTKAFPHYKQVVIIHNRLCDLCYDVNEVFDQQILILITSHFTYIICNIYYVVVIFIAAMHGHDAISKHVTFISLIMYWCCYKSVHLVWIVYFATITQNEGNKSHTLVQQRESQYFGQLLAKQNIHLSVCGLFPLDLTLLYTIVGTATTYWIILIQLQFLIPQQIPDENPATNGTAT